MKKAFPLLLFVCFSTFSFSQTDSAQATGKSFIGLYLHLGIQEMNYNELHQYGYLLNQPPNTSIQTTTGIFFGVREKMFGAAYLGYSAFFAGITLNGEKTGTYEDYKIQASGDYSNWGASFYYRVFRNVHSKFFHAIYPNAGIQMLNSTTRSQATGRGVLNADTTFYLEFGHVKSTLLNLGVMIEFPKLLKKHFGPDNSMPLTISTGYTIQLQDPKWSYTNAPANLNDPRKVNQGGFYFMIGYNIWFEKGMFKVKK